LIIDNGELKIENERMKIVVICLFTGQVGLFTEYKKCDNDISNIQQFNNKTIQQFNNLTTKKIKQ